jgi:hypothetical protein
VQAARQQIVHLVVALRDVGEHVVDQLLLVGRRHGAIAEGDARLVILVRVLLGVLLAMAGEP